MGRKRKLGFEARLATDELPHPASFSHTGGERCFEMVVVNEKPPRVLNSRRLSDNRQNQ